MSDRYYWPTLKQDVAAFVQRCQDCSAVKPFKTIRPKLGFIGVPDKRFSSLQIDVVGPMPESRGMSYLLTVFDRTSRWVEAIPMEEASALSSCRAFLEGWVQRFGLPQTATSDNGNTFVAELWKNMHQQLGIDVAFTPPYHASSLGGVERKHRDLKLGLKTKLHDMADEHGSEWMSRLPWVLLASRTAFQPELKATSAELVMGSNRWDTHGRVPFPSS